LFFVCLLFVCLFVCLFVKPKPHTTKKPTNTTKKHKKHSKKHNKKHNKNKWFDTCSARARDKRSTLQGPTRSNYWGRTLRSRKTTQIREKHPWPVLCEKNTNKTSDLNGFRSRSGRTEYTTRSGQVELMGQDTSVAQHRPKCVTKHARYDFDQNDTPDAFKSPQCVPLVLCRNNNMPFTCRLRCAVTSPASKRPKARLLSLIPS
jgi:hypothetical protein